MDSQYYSDLEYEMDCAANSDELESILDCCDREKLSDEEYENLRMHMELLMENMHESDFEDDDFERANFCNGGDLTDDD